MSDFGFRAALGMCILPADQRRNRDGREYTCFFNHFVLEVTHIMPSLIIWDDIVTLSHVQQDLKMKSLLG